VTACKSCGREPENGTETHWLGCEAIAPQVPLVELRLRTRESECAKDDCKEPRAVSKGPRPAKYCDEHKTGSKK
jgi:hypothetical protein